MTHVVVVFILSDEIKLNERENTKIAPKNIQKIVELFWEEKPMNPTKITRYRVASTTIFK